MTTPVDLKKHIRKAVRKARRALSDEQQALAAQQLSEGILTRVKQSNAKKVALFFSMDGEIGTEPAIEALWQENLEVYLPVIHPFNPNTLVFVRYESTTSLYRSELGMLEPKVACNRICPLAELDILFTPLVAFDAKGNRLGMGGGFYDRTLQSHYERNAQKPAIIGLAHQCQQVDQVPVESWDMPLKELISDKQHFLFD